MIYPKPIQDFVSRQSDLTQRFGAHVFPGELNATQRPVPADNRFEQWLRTAGYRTSADVRAYVEFMREMSQLFAAAQRGLFYRNRQAQHRRGDDKWSYGWAGEGMLPLAAYIYYLHSYGLRGGVLECGCFKGGSTCCLSWICHRLGLKLYAADSFEGLPAAEDHYYGQGDFRGGLEEVQDNLRRFGRTDCVEFITGWYAQSLAGFQQPLMLIWLDVDLQASVVDALTHVFPLLEPGGVIFSDGLGAQRDFAAGQLVAGSSESAGLLDYFAAEQLAHKAVHAGYGYLGLVVPGCRRDEHLLFEPAKLKQLLRPSLAGRVRATAARANRVLKRLVSNASEPFFGHRPPLPKRKSAATVKRVP